MHGSDGNLTRGSNGDFGGRFRANHAWISSDGEVEDESEDDNLTVPDSEDERQNFVDKDETLQDIS